MTTIRVSTTQRILFSPISSCSIQILSTIPFKGTQRKYTASQLKSMIKFESIEDTEVLSACKFGQSVWIKNIGNAIAKIAPDTIANVKDNAKLKIVDKATTPKAPTSPNVSRNVMIAFAAGLLFHSSFHSSVTFLMLKSSTMMKWQPFLTFRCLPLFPTLNIFQIRRHPKRSTVTTNRVINC